MELQRHIAGLILGSLKKQQNERPKMGQIILTVSKIEYKL